MDFKDVESARLAYYQKMKKSLANFGRHYYCGSNRWLFPCWPLFFLFCLLCPCACDFYQRFFYSAARYKIQKSLQSLFCREKPPFNFF